MKLRTAKMGKRTGESLYAVSGYFSLKELTYLKALCRAPGSKTNYVYKYLRLLVQEDMAK